MMRTILLAALCAVALAACGKKGAPSAPGPASEITYPRTYPTH
jgi:predicted small lipoprotein YifL